jgi:hypothetical protein
MFIRIKSNKGKEMTKKQFELEFHEARKLMESKDFWVKESDLQISNTAKAIWSLYCDCPEGYKSIAQATLMEFCTRATYMNRIVSSSLVGVIP